MHIMYFTERAYTDVPEEEILKRQSFFGVPNKYFDPVKGAQLLNDFRSYIGKFWVVKPKAAAIDSLLENLRRAA